MYFNKIINETQHVTGNVKFNNIDESNSPTSGALLLSGGMGVEKNVNIGGNLTIFNNTLVAGNLLVNGGKITSTNAAASVNLFHTTNGNIIFGNGNIDMSNSGYITTVRGDFIVNGNVRVDGDTVYANVVNLIVVDKLITLNSNGAIGTASGCGIEFEEANIIVGNILLNNGRNGYIMTAPDAINGSATIPIESNLQTNAIMSKSSSIQTIEQGGFAISILTLTAGTSILVFILKQ